MTTDKTKPNIDNEQEEDTLIEDNNDESIVDSETTENENNHLEMLQRLKAEFENYKKRVTREKLELSTLFKSQLVGNLLPIIDDFERMFENSSEKNDVIKLIYNKFLSVLKEEGLELIESVDKEFDPEFHEAIMIETGDDDDCNNKILAEIQKGYIFKEKLLRPAKVNVYKLKIDDEDEDKE